MLKKENISDLIIEITKVIGNNHVRKPLKIFIVAISLSLLIFQMYTAYFGILDALKQVSTYALFIMAIGFFLFPFIQYMKTLYITYRISMYYR